MYPAKVYLIGDKIFYGEKEGAKFINHSIRAFHHRYERYQNGEITAEEALSRKNLPRTKRTFRIGDKSFNGAKEGADYIGFSTRTFLNRYHDYQDGRITADEALSKQKVKRTAFKDYGNDEWKSLGTRPRDENLEKIPAATEYDNLFCPVPPAAEGDYIHESEEV